jgi:NhaP-type Na+/H+ or K+/H+ antiporter
MALTSWFLIVGTLLIFMALASSLLKRLPLSTATLYLFVGFLLGPAGIGLLVLDPIEQSAVLKVITEIAVIISLFSAGLKLRLPLTDHRWWLPVRLGTLTMLVTIALLTLLGIFALGLPVGAALVLGATLAPTDAVLASDVQVENVSDRDRVRFGLTGEAGLNDGVALPLFLLGLGLLGLHELGPNGWRWFAVDFIWGIMAGIASGWLLGFLIGHLVVYLRQVHHEAVGLEEFIALGLIAFWRYLPPGSRYATSSIVPAAKDGPSRWWEPSMSAESWKSQSTRKRRPPTWPMPCSASTTNWSASPRSA